MSAPAPAARRAALRYRFQQLEAWMQHNLTADLSVAGLADRVLMTRRSFARAYREVMGVPPAKAVERLRVAAATRLLGELSDSPVSTARVGHLCGFRSLAVFQRAFIRQHGMSPDQWLNLDATTSPGARRMTEDQERTLQENVDTIDKRVMCLSAHLDQQVSFILLTLQEQLDRIERQVGGNPPSHQPLGEDTPADALLPEAPAMEVADDR
jgi:AraC-like DNA-binding protein